MSDSFIERIFISWSLPQGILQDDFSDYYCNVVIWIDGTVVSSQQLPPGITCTSYIDNTSLLNNTRHNYHIEVFCTQISTDIFSQITSIDQVLTY